MDGRCVYLCLMIFIINFLSVTNGGNKKYIKDFIKVKPFNDRLGSKQLQDIVVKALAARYKNRKMLEVSKTRYNIHMAWRGLKNFFWKKMLNVFCPMITRELKAVKVLKDALIHDNYSNNIKERFNLKLPFKQFPKKGKKKTRNEESDEESEENSDEGSDEEDDKESDEKYEKKKNPQNKSLDDLLN